MSSGRLSHAFTQSRSGDMQQEKRTRKGKAQVHENVAAISPPEPTAEELDESALRQFDLDPKFGPVTGISRLQRWERAHKMDLHPPASVKETILKHGGEGSAMNKHLFEEGVV